MEKSEMIRILSDAEPILEKAVEKNEELKNLQSQVPDYKDPDVAAKDWPTVALLLTPFSIIGIFRAIYYFEIFKLIFWVGFLIILVIRILKSPERKRKAAEESNKKRENNLIPVEKKSHELADLLEKFNNTGINNVLPLDYQSVQCIHFVKSYLINGRADTIKEALNLYEEELHRYRLELNAQSTAQAAKDAANSASWAAVGTWVNTFKN